MLCETDGTVIVSLKTRVRADSCVLPMDLDLFEKRVGTHMCSPTDYLRALVSGAARNSCATPALKCIAG